MVCLPCSEKVVVMWRVEGGGILHIAQGGGGEHRMPSYLHSRWLQSCDGTPGSWYMVCGLRWMSSPFETAPASAKLV